ncbi:MAG: ParB/RepB/Spo0J family partition protein [Opitutales bacterium]|nr:ParB/RepB/Spo0J family partition protein [Opitutales bacterium]
MAYKKPIGRGLSDIIHNAGISSFNNAATPKQPNGKNPAGTKKSPEKTEPKNVAPATKMVSTINSNILPYREIPLDKIVCSPTQSRKNFPAESLQDLANSIRAEGLLQPIIVRKKPRTNDSYELIAGERRLRAFGLLKLPKIPCRVVEASDASSAAMCLIENLQRENLNPIEEAIGLGTLMRDFNLTQEAVAERVGKARPTISNTLRLLELDPLIQGFISSGKLSAGHAKALLSVKNTTDRMLLANKLVESKDSVRVAEELAAKLNEGKSILPQKTGTTRIVTPEISQLERKLTSKFQTRVQVLNGKKKGRIVLFYNNNEDLERLLEAIGYSAN